MILKIINNFSYLSCKFHETPREYSESMFCAQTLMIEISILASFVVTHGLNCRHFADDSFTFIFMNVNFLISIQISLKFVSTGPIDNKPALVQVMACRRIGAKSLFEPMLSRFTDAYMRH